MISKLRSKLIDEINPCCAERSCEKSSDQEKRGGIQYIFEKKVGFALEKIEETSEDIINAKEKEKNILKKWRVDYEVRSEISGAMFERIVNEL